MELNCRHLRHLISMVPAIAAAAALNNSASHDAQRKDSFKFYT